MYTLFPATPLFRSDDTAFFALPEITRATMPGFGGTQRLARLVGRLRAMEICLTGRRVHAAEASTIGMINQVVPAGELLAHAQRLAQSIADRKSTRLNSSH